VADNGWIWVRSLLNIFRGNGLPQGKRSSNRVRPQLEALEDRWVPSTLDLTTAGATTISIRPATLNDVFLHLTSAARARTEVPA